MPPLEPPQSEQPMTGQATYKPPTTKQQSWGTIVSLVIIVLMIVVGALYAWGKRVAEQNAILEQAEAQQF